MYHRMSSSDKLVTCVAFVIFYAFVFAAMWILASDVKNSHRQECSSEKERIAFLEKCLQGGNGADSCDLLSRRMFCKKVNR